MTLADWLKTSSEVDKDSISHVSQEYAVDNGLFSVEDSNPSARCHLLNKCRSSEATAAETSTESNLGSCPEYDSSLMRFHDARGNLQHLVPRC
jgi:hypothetical protein